MFSLIIPVHKNSQSIPDLLKITESLNKKLNNNLEVVFVIDGNPENEFEILKALLPNLSFKSQLILHSKTFGSFPAIKTGLEQARGKYFATMAADLQEPPELILKIFKHLKNNDCDIVIGNRTSREEDGRSVYFSKLFWFINKKFIQKDMPSGGVDAFGCNETVRKTLVCLKENNTSLIGLLFWIGFKRVNLNYVRAKRKYGKSAWNYKSKIKYMIDSIFSFSDIPIILLIASGVLGIFISIILSIIVIISKIAGTIPIPGYTATFLIVSFFSSLNIFSFGILGLYLWRTFENTKNRPNSIISKKITYH